MELKNVKGKIVMIEGKYLFGANSDLSDVFEIRRKVFVEEENILEKYEFDDFDNYCVHGMIAVNGKKLGTGRILYDGDEYRIGHIAILKEERGKKYGDFLVRMLIDKAFLNGAQEVVVGAKISVIPFYEKIGFKQYGTIYLDTAGIERMDMKVTKVTLCKECKKM
ncbi:MAG: GNAT family N-acetyltransferase [Bacteroidales bacterium]